MAISLPGGRGTIKGVNAQNLYNEQLRSRLAEGEVRDFKVTKNCDLSAAQDSITFVGTGTKNAPDFENSWVNFGGGQVNDAGYWKDSQGYVHLQGVIKSGTVNNVAFTLPADYIPDYTHIFAVVSNGVFGRVDVQNNGGVNPVSGNNTYFSLDGIVYRP